MPPPTSTLTGTSTPDYSFSLNFAPNGDVLTANDSVNSNWNYAYDQFNRLVCSNLASNGTCASPTSGTPTYSYVYDRFGNRWQQNGQFSFSASFTGNSPAQPANNNRLDGYTYDAAGNLLSDGNHTYFYDAENRLIQVDGTLGTCSSGGTAGTTACYYYDAEGHRVWRTGFTSDTCDATGKRGYVFDLAGHWVAEVNGNGGGCTGEIYAGSRHVATSDGDIHLDHTDWLGTSRLRTDYQYTTSHGFWIGDSCASLPFGDGLNCTSTFDYHLHFTGKELDNESGLDEFGARYYSSALGRFTIPDWAANAVDVPYANFGDPQSLNLYSYVKNNPLNSTDPDGHCCLDWLKAHGKDIAVGVAKAVFNSIAPGSVPLFDLWQGGQGPNRVDIPRAQAANNTELATMVATTTVVITATFVAPETESVSPSQTLSTTDTLQGLANQAVDTIGSGSGATYGTLVHSEFSDLVEGLGNPNLFTEQSYLNGNPVSYGTPGSIRIDVGEGTVDAPTAAYDLKTGSAKLTPQRVAQVQSNLPNGSNVPVTEIKPQQ